MLRIGPLVFAMLIALAASGFAQSSAPRPETAAPAAKAGPMVNINTATAAELEQLPGIGARVAARIVEYRTKKGPFRKAEELMNVQGIGEKSFLKIRAQLTVAGGPSASQQ
jgi:competence protein ComEA